MELLQFSLMVSDQQADTLSSCLTAVGAVAITLEEGEAAPLYQSSTEATLLWDNMRLVALFPYDVDKALIFRELASYVDVGVLGRAQWQVVQQQDWQHKWKENLQPMYFGNNIWVCPSWCEIPDVAATNIILDPDMAFGTGSHQTTALCMEWLAHHDLSNRTVLDFGCGSGILAIAAAKLGARMVYAVDIDPTALTVCQNNAMQNNIDPDTCKILLPEQVTAIQADILIANILAEPLLTLAPTFAKLVSPKATLVMSGILNTQVELITQTYQQWCSEFTIVQRDEWVRISAVYSCQD